jgi:hypothetical protein
LTAVHPHAQRAEGGERRELQPVAVAAEVQRAGLPSRRGGRRRRRWSHRPRRRHRRRWSGRRRRWWRRRRRRRRCTGQYRRGKWPSKTPPPDHPTTEPRRHTSRGRRAHQVLSLSLSLSLSLNAPRGGGGSGGGGDGGSAGEGGEHTGNACPSIPCFSAARCAEPSGRCSTVTWLIMPLRQLSPALRPHPGPVRGGSQWEHGSQLPYARTTVRSPRKLDHGLTL